MSESSLLLSIRPEYAEKIIKGIKTVELRRVRPKVSKGDRLLVYVSSPVRELQAIVIVEDVISIHPRQLWEKVSNRAGISRSEFDCYFEGAKMGYAIVFKEVWQLVYPIKLSMLRERIPGFKPPQCYHYYPEDDFLSLLSIPFT